MGGEGKGEERKEDTTSARPHLGAQALQAPLDNVVAVQVLDQRHHARHQRLRGQRHLLRRAQRLNQFLHRAGSMRVQCDCDQLGDTLTILLAVFPLVGGS